MKTYNWAILAPGTIAHRFTKGLAITPNAIPYAVGSRDLNRAQAFANEYGYIKAYGSYEELAQDPNIDIIYVATPHPFHEEAAILCLQHGKPVLCEKPFAVNAKQASRMIECARAKNTFLMEAMWTRFLPAVRKAMELITSGAIGAIRHIIADFGFRAEFDPASRLFSPDMAGGSLLDVGIYNLAFSSMIYGRQPDRIQSYMDIGSTGVDETTAALLSYDKGQSAQLFSSIRLNTAHEAVIYGEAGHIRLPSYWCAKTVLLHNKNGLQEINLPCETEGFQFEAIEVMACLEKGMKESPIMPLDETLGIMQTMDKIRFDNNLFYPFELM